MGFQLVMVAQRPSVEVLVQVCVVAKAGAAGNEDKAPTTAATTAATIPREAKRVRSAEVRRGDGMIRVRVLIGSPFEKFETIEKWFDWPRRWRAEKRSRPQRKLL